METTFFESKDEGGRFIDCPFFIWDNDGFHIIFATIWVGLPLMILVAELHYHYVVMKNVGQNHLPFFSVSEYRPEPSQVFISSYDSQT